MRSVCRFILTLCCLCSRFLMIYQRFAISKDTAIFGFKNGTCYFEFRNIAIMCKGICAIRAVYIHAHMCLCTCVCKYVHFMYVYMHAHECVCVLVCLYVHKMSLGRSPNQKMHVVSKDNMLYIWLVTTICICVNCLYRFSCC